MSCLFRDLIETAKVNLEIPNAFALVATENLCVILEYQNHIEGSRELAGGCSCDSTVAAIKWKSFSVEPVPADFWADT